MNTRDVVRRLRAFHEGRPLPRGEKKQFWIADQRNTLVVAFVRMGGESRPWGVAYGRPDDTPWFLTVTEARDRDAVAGMMAEFAGVLLEHLATPGYASSSPTSPDTLGPARQLWLPNPTHLDMLHHLNYAYTFTTWGGGNQERLNALGRACGWLFREAHRPGQMAVGVATEVLRTAYTFPAEDVRQGHLGFLLAWLDTPGGRDARMAAAMEAERQSIATSLDPTVDREVLAPALEAWQRAPESSRAKKQAAARIEARLTDELQRRWDLTVRAIEVLRADPRPLNAGVAELVKATREEQRYQHTRLELQLSDHRDGPAFVASAETDRFAPAAASRFHVHVASAEFVESVMIHDDAELLADAIAAGDAVRGVVASVRDDGIGKATRPVWVIVDRSPGPLRLREGSRVCVWQVPNREAEVRAIRTLDDGSLAVEVEITNLKTIKADLPAPHHLAPNDQRWVGKIIAVVPRPAHSISRTKSQRVWDSSGPGAWLTHRRPGGPGAHPAPGDRDESVELAVT